MNMKQNENKKETINAKASNRGLGRGLDALFEDEEGIYPQADKMGDTPGAQRLMVGLDQLEPGSYQPRREFNDDSLKELAASIAVHGVLQPLVVRPKVGFEGMYEIIAGERRWRASQRAQLHEVPVVIKDLNDEQALEIALIENLQREDLNAVEEAMGYRLLIEEFGHTQEKAAAALGKSRSHVANMLRLLKLPSKVLDMLKDSRISAGHARAIISTDDPLAMAQMIVSKGLSVRETENFVNQSVDKSGGKKSSAKSKIKDSADISKDVDTLSLEKEISAALGMNVKIEVGKDYTNGQVAIEFKSLDQLDEILHRLSHFPGRQQEG
jgi:ParB family chromosome partitioning protein